MIHMAEVRQADGQEVGEAGSCCCGGPQQSRSIEQTPLSLPRNVLWTCCSALLTHSQITSGLDNSLAVIFLYPDWFWSVAFMHTRAAKRSVIQCNTL